MRSRAAQTKTDVCMDDADDAPDALDSCTLDLGLQHADDGVHDALAEELGMQLHRMIKRCLRVQGLAQRLLAEDWAAGEGELRCRLVRLTVKNMTTRRRRLVRLLFCLQGRLVLCGWGPSGAVAPRCSRVPPFMLCRRRPSSRRSRAKRHTSGSREHGVAAVFASDATSASA